MLEQNPAFQDLAAPVLDNLLFQWCVDPLDVLQKWTAGDPLCNETHLVRCSNTNNSLRNQTRIRIAHVYHSV